MRDKTYRDGSKMEFVHRVVRHVGVGDVTAIAIEDIANHELSVARFRMCLGKIGDDFGMKFRTRLSLDGVLVIKRVE